MARIRIITVVMEMRKFWKMAAETKNDNSEFVVNLTYILFCSVYYLISQKFTGKCMVTGFCVKLYLVHPSKLHVFLISAVF